MDLLLDIEGLKSKIQKEMEDPATLAGWLLTKGNEGRLAVRWGRFANPVCLYLNDRFTGLDFLYYTETEQVSFLTKDDNYQGFVDTPIWVDQYLERLGKMGRGDERFEVLSGRECLDVLEGMFDVSM